MSSKAGIQSTVKEIKDSQKVNNEAIHQLTQGAQNKKNKKDKKKIRFKITSHAVKTTPTEMITWENWGKDQEQINTIVKAEVLTDHRQQGKYRKYNQENAVHSQIQQLC